MKAVRTLTCLVAVIGALTPIAASGQFLVINDCNGFTRAAERIGDQAQKVEFDIGNARDGARVTLTNNATGAVTVSDVVGKSAIFFDVLPGVYTITTEDTNLFINAINLSPMPLVGGVTSMIVGGLVVGGGATGGILAIHELTKGDPSGEPTPAPSPSPTPTPQPDCPVCDPDDSPPSLDDEDDFFDERPPFDDATSASNLQLSPAT